MRQFFSTLGFFAGFFLGIWINNLFAGAINDATAQAVLTIVLVLALALALMAAGEFAGSRLKFRLQETRVKTLDKVFGSAIAAATILAAIWLGAAVLRNLPANSMHQQVEASGIVTLLNNNLPSAPALLTQLGNLINPNNPPRVFTGDEPLYESDTPLPNMGELNQAVEKARASVVKIEGEGCSKIVEGSGFVAARGLVVTNAHVVAGVRQPFVLDQNGRHNAQTVLFDPNMDLAILRTSSSLAGKPLTLEAQEAEAGTAAAVLGFPSGGSFTAGPGAVLESFVAQGHNIYDQGVTFRGVYSVKTNIVKGNSGGPMINQDGKVIGVMFAKSTTQDQIGYALTMKQVNDKIEQARNLTSAVSTRSCTS